MTKEADAHAALERRVRALEEALAPSTQATAPPGDGRWWVLDRLATNTGPAFERNGVAGSVVYGGRTRTAGSGELVWQAEHPVPAILEADLTDAAGVFGALGHPVRLEIMRCLLLGGHTLADLQHIPGVGTSGQLHHHLRELRAAGLVVHRRNHYSITSARVVPWLVMLAAAAGPESLTSPVLHDEENADEEHEENE